MKNLLPYKLFESFSSQKLNVIVPKLETAAKKRFIKTLSKVCECVDLSIEDIDDSMIQYLPFNKALELSGEKEKEIKWVKFWMTLNYDLTDVTVCDSPPVERASQKLSDYSISKRLQIGSIDKNFNKITSNAEFIKVISKLPQFQTIEITVSKNGRSSKLIGHIFSMSSNLLLLHPNPNYNDSELHTFVPKDILAKYGGYAFAIAWFWPEEIPSSKVEKGWNIVQTEVGEFDAITSVLVLNKKKNMSVALEKRVWTKSESSAVTNLYPREDDNIFWSKFYFMSGATVDEIITNYGDAFSKNGRKWSADFAVVLDYEKLCEKAKSSKKLSDIRNVRDLRVPELKGEDLVQLKNRERVETILNKMTFEPTTESIQKVFDIVFGGKYMFFYMTLPLSTDQVNLISEIRQLCQTKEYFEEIENLWKKSVSHQMLSKEESDKLDKWFEKYEKNMNEILRLVRLKRKDNINYNQLLHQELQHMKNSKKEKQTHTWKQGRLFNIGMSNGQTLYNLVDREVLMANFYEDFIELSNYVYDILSPFDYDVFGKDGKIGLLDGWAVRYNKIRQVILDENDLNVKAIPRRMLKGEYIPFIKYDELYGYDTTYRMDDLDIQSLPSVKTKLMSEIDKLL